MGLDLHRFYLEMKPKTLSCDQVNSAYCRWLENYVSESLSLHGGAYGGPQLCYAAHAVPALPDNESELGRILLPKQVESQLTKTLF